MIMAILSNVGSTVQSKVEQMKQKVFAHKQSISGIPNQIKTKMATKSSRTGDRIKIEEDEWD